MEPAKSKTIQAKIYEDPELRGIAYESHQEAARRREAEAAAEAERAQDRGERLKAFWQMLGFTPGADEKPKVDLLQMEVADAWVYEHPELDEEFASTLGALARQIQRERMRMKAARRIFREIGIK